MANNHIWQHGNGASNEFRVLYAILLCGMLTACSKPVSHFPHTQTVKFNDVEFAIDKISSNIRLANQKRSSYTDQSSRWVVVTMSMKNVRKSPIEHISHPKCKSFSSSGAEYSENLTLGYTENSKIGYSSFQPMNPQVTVKRIIYFQVQPGEYALSVLVPTFARSSIEFTHTYSEMCMLDIPDVKD